MEYKCMLEEGKLMMNESIKLEEMYEQNYINYKNEKYNFDADYYMDGVMNEHLGKIKTH